MAFENRKTLAESADGTIKVVEYENKDIRVSIVGAGRFTIERVAFDGKGGNIMLRSDEREHPRDQPVTPPAATRRPRAEKARKPVQN